MSEKGQADPQHPAAVRVRAEWVGVENTPLMFANTFALQNIKSEFILICGVATPPMLDRVITQEEAEKLKLEIRPFIRIAMTPERLVELIGLLQQQLRVYSENELKN